MNIVYRKNNNKSDVVNDIYNLFIIIFLLSIYLLVL